MIDYKQMFQVRQQLIKYHSQLFWVGAIGSIGTIIAMECSSKKTDTQLGIFTFFETLVVCCGAMFYESEIIFLAMILTFAASVSLGIYAMTTNYDFGKFQSLTLLMIQIYQSLQTQP